MAEPFRPRPAQEHILSYTGGYMGVSAVPGSGKTFTLSLLAAKLVQQLARTAAFDDREVLIVTFTNSAVENFRSRIARLLAEEGGLLPGVGYRSTLHGLAHDTCAAPRPCRPQRGLRHRRRTHRCRNPSRRRTEVSAQQPRRPQPLH